MITTDEILARMRNGESADNIADELAKMLNLAQKELAKEQSKSKSETDFKRACENAADAVNDALDAYAHWKDTDMSDYMWTAETAANIIELLSSIGDLLDLFDLSPAKKPAGPTEVKTININNGSAGSDLSGDFESIVENFLKKNGIK